MNSSNEFTWNDSVAWRESCAGLFPSALCAPKMAILDAVHLPTFFLLASLSRLWLNLKAVRYAVAGWSAENGHPKRLTKERNLWSHYVMWTRCERIIIAFISVQTVPCEVLQVIVCHPTCMGRKELVIIWHNIMLLWSVKIYERNLKKLQFTKTQRCNVTALRSPLMKTLHPIKYIVSYKASFWKFLFLLMRGNLLAECVWISI